MSYSVITVVFGVPLNDAVGRKMQEWESDPNDSRWFETNEGQCGFTTLYSASGDLPYGYCGVELCQLPSYEPTLLTSLKLQPTEEQIAEAMQKVAKLHPELLELAVPIGTYFIWSDS